MASRKGPHSALGVVVNVITYLRNIDALRESWLKSESATSRGDQRALWFRGQPDASWGLTPSRWRKEFADETESDMRLEFESVGRQLVPSDSQRDKWGWYFLMAHYGAPTRLLDWTTNPLVALYFAAASEPRERDACVWIVDPWKWNKAHVRDLYAPALPGWRETEPYLWDLERAMESDNLEIRRKWPVAIEPPHIDGRIAAQEGKFVLFGTEKNMCTSPNVAKKSRKTLGARLDKMVISARKRECILDELDKLSVNEKSLFPDLGGLGRYIRWKWKTF